MEALGMIETMGMLATVEALDSMLKSADVSLVNCVKVGGGHIAVMIKGDVGAVKAAVDAGATAVNALYPEALLLEHVIPRPESSISGIIIKKDPEEDPDKDPETPDPEPATDLNEETETEEAEVISAEIEVSEEPNAEESAEADEPAGESADDNNSTEEATEAQESQSSSEEEIPSSEEDERETEETSAEEVPAEEAETAEAEAVEAEVEDPAQAETEAEENTDISDSGATETSELSEEAEPSAAEPAVKTELPQVKDRESIDQIATSQGVEVLKDVLGGLRVSELRKLARGYKNFSLTGRDISKANKKMLIEAFENYYK